MSDVTGFDELENKLRLLAQNARPIAMSAVMAGANAMKRAAKGASPGTIPNEIAARPARGSDTAVRAVVGLGVAGNKSTNPHGRFLTLGTKYIQARHFVRQAFESAVPSAMSAMRRAAKRSMRRIMKGAQ